MFAMVGAETFLSLPAPPRPALPPAPCSLLPATGIPVNLSGYFVKLKEKKSNFNRRAELYRKPR